MSGKKNLCTQRILCSRNFQTILQALYAQEKKRLQKRVLNVGRVFEAEITLPIQFYVEVRGVFSAEKIHNVYTDRSIFQFTQWRRNVRSYQRVIGRIFSMEKVSNTHQINVVFTYPKCPCKQVPTPPYKQKPPICCSTTVSISIYTPNPLLLNQICGRLVKKQKTKKKQPVLMLFIVQDKQENIYCL